VDSSILGRDSTGILQLSNPDVPVDIGPFALLKNYGISLGIFGIIGMAYCTILTIYWQRQSYDR
jgi:hypothetical protein